MKTLFTIRDGNSGFFLERVVSYAGWNKNKQMTVALEGCHAVELQGDDVVRFLKAVGNLSVYEDRP
jgi:hypothetical protein